jgi:hypothetical protein
VHDPIPALAGRHAEQGHLWRGAAGAGDDK